MIPEIKTEISESFEDLHSHWIRKINEKVRERIYKKLVAAGRRSQQIIQIRSDPSHPVVENVRRELHRAGQSCYGIGLHKDLWYEIRRKTRDLTDDPSATLPKLHGTEVLFDPRRLRDEALLFRSEPIWKAYRELLNDEIPSFLTMP
jgi:hypothetical protein